MKRKTFIYTFVLGSGSLLFHGIKLNAGNLAPGNTLIKMIYNNTGECSGLENAWGLSIWIENEDGVILFDTGGDPKVLLNNMKHLGLGLNKVDRIMISHDHWDHHGGLAEVLKHTRKGMDLYVPIQDAEKFTKDYPSANVIGIDEPKKIHKNTWSSGSLNFTGGGYSIDEHSVVLLNENSLVILNGCSHPGIVNIVDKVKSTHADKKILLVAGGFHMMRTPAKNVRKISQELKDLGVEKIAPSHCTGDGSIDIFREEWGDRFVDMNIGNEMML